MVNLLTVSLRIRRGAMSGIKDIWHYANHTIKSARQVLNERLQPLGLSSAEGNVLLSLLSGDQVLRQEDLVAQLEISKPAVSRALLSLETKGLVTRERDAADKRVSRVYLTEKAHQIGPEVQGIYENIFDLASEGISEEEIAIFIGIFRRVSKSFSRQRGADDVSK